MGLLGAFGLTMAYLIAVVVVYSDSLQTYGLATLAIAVPVGFLAGGSYAVLPRLSCGAARRSGTTPPLLGALWAGSLLGVWMWVPNWFLGIGCASGCPWYSWLLWLVPGLLVGPLLGLMLVLLRWRVAGVLPSAGGPVEVVDVFWLNALPFAAVTLVGGLGMAAVRSLPWFTFPHVDRLGLVVLLWGLGGAILGTMLGAGWYVTLPAASSWYTSKRARGRPTVTLGNLWWVLLGRPMPKADEGGETR
jgi:hypothetical protein